jgi:hypothetical protein
MIDFLNILSKRRLQARIDELEKEIEQAYSDLFFTQMKKNDLKIAFMDKEKLLRESIEENKRMKKELDITLVRTYSDQGTNGDLYVNDHLICHTIELPWRENRRQVSCIPEGVYQLSKRNSTRFGDHIYVAKVPGRSAILIHAANNAATELQGCIAPVTRLSGPGRGTQSRLALGAVINVVYGGIDSGKKVFLHISSKE